MGWFKSCLKKIKSNKSHQIQKIVEKPVIQPKRKKGLVKVKEKPKLKDPSILARLDDGQRKAVLSENPRVFHADIHTSGVYKYGWFIFWTAPLFQDTKLG